MIKYILIFLVFCLPFSSFANDECINAIELTPSAACINTLCSFNGMTISSPAPSCGTQSLQDIWYKFTATDLTMSITLDAKFGLNHGFEVISGNCNGEVLQCVNNNGVSIGETYFRNTFIIGQVYYIRVFNAGFSISTAEFGICVQTFPTPSNDVCANAVQLTPSLNCVNTQGTFSGAMMDGSIPSCATAASQDVWYKFTATDSTMSITLDAEFGLNHGFEVISGNCNGEVLQCINNNGISTAETYFRNTFSPGQQYYIRVFNVSAGLSVKPFGICVQKFPSPVNDACANAIELTPSLNCVNTMVTFSGAMMNGAAPSCATASSQDVWYKFTATDATMSITLAPESGLNHAFEIISGSCNGPVFQCVNSYAISQFEIYFNNNFNPGQVYYIRVLNTSAGLSTKSFGICVQKYPSPVNDLCANALELTPNTTCTNTTGTFSGSMLDGDAPTCATNSSQDVWYKFTATSSNMGIQLSAVSGLNHGFQLIEGNCSGTAITCMNNFPSGTGESANFTSLIVGQTYYIKVINISSGLSTNTFGICVTGPAPINCVPSIVISTSSTSICQGDNVTFNAIPSNGGTAPVYQWKVNGNNVGSNNASFSTSSLNNSDIVTCVMQSNAACANPLSATSNAISVSVSSAVTPSFTQIPAICVGESITFPTSSNNGIIGTWNPALNNTTTTNYTFTPNANQCAISATMTVTVNSINTEIVIQDNIITSMAVGANYQWINCSGNQTISGANAISYAPVSDGSYAVILSLGTCVDTSNCLTFITLNLNEIAQDGWNIYPNPTTHQISIDLNKSTYIEILDMNGKLVISQQLLIGHNSINTEVIKPGIYYIKSEFGLNYKFIKE